MKRDDDRRRVYGRNPVLEWLEADAKSIRALYVASSGGTREIEDRARRAGVPVRSVPSREIDRWARGKVHQGVVAELAPFAYAEWPPAGEAWPETVVVLDQVTDPRNLGAILRVAAAAGAGAALIPKDRAVGVTPVVEKAAAGATTRLAVARITNVARTLVDLRDEGYRTVGLDARGGTPLWEADLDGRLAWVVGSEGAGLRPLVRRHCDELVAIPMPGGVESLNVAVAAGICLFERVRREAGERRR